MDFGDIVGALSDYMGDDGSVTFITGVVVGVDHQDQSELVPTSYTVVSVYGRGRFEATVAGAAGYETNQWTAYQPATKNLWYDPVKNYSDELDERVTELCHEEWIDHTDGDYVLLAAGETRCVIVGAIEKPRMNRSLAASKWQTPGGADELEAGKSLPNTGWTVPTAAPNTLAWHSEQSLPTTTARSHPDLQIDRFGATVKNRWMQAGEVTEIRAYGSSEYAGDYTALDELSVYRSRREALGHQLDLRQTGAGGLETVRGLKISPASTEESNESNLGLDYTPLVRHNQLLVVINKLQAQLSDLTDEYNSLRSDLQQANASITALSNRWTTFSNNLAVSQLTAIGAVVPTAPISALASAASAANPAPTQSSAGAVNQDLPTSSEKTACRSLRVKGGE